MIRISAREDSEINEIVKGLKFLPTSKKALKYSFVANADFEKLPALSYTEVKKEQPVETRTSDGVETKNIAKVGDYVFCGPSRELYVLTESKVKKMYEGKIGDVLTPEQSPRQVAIYNGEETSFTAPWGESMILKPDDYLVKEQDNSGYYRIAKKEYEATYNTPGKTS